MHLFWDNSWVALRVAGSGSTPYPAPDILAGKGGRVLVIECKSSGELSRHIPQQQVDDLVLFAGILGAEPWIGVRFNDMKWAFFAPDDLKKTGTGYSISVKMTKDKGLAFEQLLGIF
ncbi:Holliday junction resolvase [Candidatus Woesearchaeota archaeon]|nr:Holliday junction resolvase [Candidatus Woesearchaeota archaeon]